MTARFTPTTDTASYLSERFRLGFGEGRLHPVARGAMGRIWRLSLPGHDYAVKELFWTSDEAAVTREAAFRDAAAAAGVASPLNLRTHDGRYICTLPPDLGGAAVRMFSWVEGSPVNRDDPRLPTWVGHTLGVLHALRHPCDGITTDPWFDHVPEPTRWDELMAEAEATKQPWAAALAESLPLLRSLTPHVKRVDPAALIYNHMDFQPQNVLTDTAGEHVLVDWEDAGPGMPDRVLAGRLCAWGMHDGTIDAERVRQILRAYRRAGGHASLTSLESFSSVLAGHVNYIDAQASLSLDTTQPPDMRDHATAELTHSLADPPRLDLFRELLEIVQGCGPEK
jgi:Ser/Thr protein kinase RdoA (MazF antagonist)